MLVAVLVLVAIAPAVQTWVAQRALGDRPGLQGSLDSLSAGFGEVDIEGLVLKSDGAVLTLPSLQARIPITASVMRREIEIRSLVARGWTLKLGRGAQAGAPFVPAAAAAVSTQEVVRVFRGILGGWKIPVGGSLDGVDLEGDVRFDSAPGGKAVQVHVTVTGGGMSAGRDGVFAVDASAAGADSGAAGIGVHGSLVVGMGSPRRIDHLGISAGFSGQGGSQHDELNLSADVSANRGQGAESYAIDLSRGNRHVASILGRFPEASGRFEGSWKVDLRDSDLAPLAPDRPLPSISATGEGSFDADAAFSRVHLLGGLVAVAGRLAALAPALDPIGTLTLGARFDLARSGRSTRVENLSVTVAGARPVGVIKALQPFDVDEGSWALSVADPRADWLDASIGGLPLAWLSGLTGGRIAAAGDAKGEFAIRASNGGFAVRSKEGLFAGGVSVRSAGRLLASGLDLSLSLSAGHDAAGWRVQWAPLAVDGAGRRLASIEGKASRPNGAGQAISIGGKWTCDLAALASGPQTPGFGWVTARSASGDFSGSLGFAGKMDATMSVVGRAPGDTFAASAHAELGKGGAVAFTMPMKVTSGSGESQLSAEGTWVGDRDGNWVDGKLTGGSVDLEHLRRLAAALAAVGGAARLPVPEAEGGGAAAGREARDKVPFWGDWTGHLAVAFDHLRTGDQEFGYVGGVFDVDGGSIQMTEGRGSLDRHVLTNVAGSVLFDAAGEVPYSVKASAALADLDAAPLFGAQPPGRDPPFEGRFNVQATLSGNGVNLDDLLRRTQEEFRLTSAAGIIRLFGANVAEALPEDDSSSVSDSLGTVGSAVGSVFGLRKDSAGSGKSSVSRNADAVLNFTYQAAEIGYDRVAVTAIRGSDGTIRIASLEMTSPDEHVTGSGRIDYAKGVPLGKRPLSVELEFGVRGKPAELLATAGLLAPEKDSLGYAVVNQPVRFGGSLEHIDDSLWTGLLVKAATRKPEGAKKGG